MARNPKIEAILEAWWEWEHNEPPARQQAEAKLNRLLDGVIGDSPYTREQVLDTLWSQYVDYKITRFRQQKVQIAQSATKTT